MALRRLWALLVAAVLVAAPGAALAQIGGGIAGGLGGSGGASGGLQPSNNLSDVGDPALARTNLGLGTAATQSVGTTAGSVAAGNDSRITGAAQKSANLSDLSNGATARANLGLGGASVLNVGTAAGTVAAGDDSRLTGAAQKASNLSDLANVATARTNLGLPASATTDTTNATNISSGTLPAARLPNPSASTLGGVQSATAGTNQFQTGISTSGVPSFAQPASTNLSDVITGTWTPTVQGSTTAGSPTYTLQVGSYERIGRNVTVRFNLTLSSLGSMAGNLLLNLPITATATSGDYGTCSWGYLSGVMLPSGYYSSSAYVAAGSNQATVMAFAGNGAAGATSLGVSAVSATTQIVGVCHYRT